LALRTGTVVPQVEDFSPDANWIALLNSAEYNWGRPRMPTSAYLSLGSNIGNRENQLNEAIGRLQALGRVVAVSSFYETEPVEFADQPWFLNCVVLLETTEAPAQFLANLLAIEQEMGRVRREKKGPRTIDIDILLLGDMILDSSELTVPHPAMHQRRFVLGPLAEIAPDVQHPILKKTIRRLLEDLPAGPAVTKLPKT
jgi:2-amino-4-hydroxy-6-hydroxymethyldihydropteridine diphosphokinase